MTRSWTETMTDLEEADRARIEPALSLVYAQAVASAELQGRVEELRKADQSPVTVVDLLHQMQFQSMLAGSFAEDGLISEEPRSLQEAIFEEASELSSSVYGIDLGRSLPDLPERGDVTWVMDPIDGTKGFVGGRCFAIALGYFRRATPHFGVLAVPAGDPAVARKVDRKLAFGIAGHGAWWTEVRAGEAPQWQPLETPAFAGSEDPDRRLSRPRRSSRRAAGTAGEDLEVVRLDSQAKYLAVAAGEIDAYLRAKRDDGIPDVIWDHMPAALVAEESGARVTHFDGLRVEFRPEEAVSFRGGVACCRPSVEEELQGRVLKLTQGS